MILFFCFLNGVQHGLGNDHLIAITTLVGRGGKLRESARLGLQFGIGHVGLLLVLGTSALLGNFGVTVWWESKANIFAGGLLILLGAWTFTEWLKEAGYIHSHPHQHSGQEHEHLHFHFKARHPHRHVHPHFSTLLGALFALSGLRSLLLSAVPVLQSHSVFWALIYVLLFGAGGVTSMSLYGWMAGSALGRCPCQSWITLLLSASSVTLGTYWISTS